MKFMLILLLSVAARAHADSFTVYGDKADSLVNAMVNLGEDPVGTHEYFQAGVTACSKQFDTKGDYFPNGQIGDYIGEACMVYGESYKDDVDGVLREQVLIPPEDRDLNHHPEIKANLQQLKALRLALETLVTPITKSLKVGNQEVLIEQTVGIAGVACDGRTSEGVRQCAVLPSHLCPPRLHSFQLLRVHEWFCTASGYDFNNRPQSISGDTKPTRPEAEQSALSTCMSLGFAGCQVRTCIDESMPD